MSLAEVIAHEARVSKKPMGGTPDPALDDEGRFNSVEGELHDQIDKYVKLKGWLAFHGRMDKKTGRTKGENDFHCLLPGGKVVFVECKTKTGKLTVDQVGVSVKMSLLGHKMHIVRSLDDFIAICVRVLSDSRSEPSKSSATQDHSDSSVSA